MSCTSITGCIAVGLSNGGLLAERWDGTSWSIQPTAKPTATALLSAVSCASVTACTAVGDDGIGGNYGDVPLVEHWDGTSWSIQSTPNLPTTNWDGTSWAIQTTPNPPYTTDSALSGVSCTSITVCTAVGEFIPGPLGQMALAEDHS